MLDITMKLKKDNKVFEWLESTDNKLAKQGHIGTHIDVYKKTDVPLEYFKTKAIIIDCSNYDLDKEIGIEITKNIDIQKNDFVIFRSNIQEQYEYGSDIYINNHHQLSFELIDYLISKEIAFIGVDFAGIRRGKEHVQADIKAEENKLYIIENLDLKALDGKINNKVDAYTLWIENPFCTGLSTRILLDI